jgi:hypothetical protein
MIFGDAKTIAEDAGLFGKKNWECVIRKRKRRARRSLYTHPLVSASSSDDWMVGESDLRRAQQ